MIDYHEIREHILGLTNVVVVPKSSNTFHIYQK